MTDRDEDISTDQEMSDATTSDDDEQEDVELAQVESDSEANDEEAGEGEEGSDDEMPIATKKRPRSDSFDPAETMSKVGGGHTFNFPLEKTTDEGREYQRKGDRFVRVRGPAKHYITKDKEPPFASNEVISSKYTLYNFFFMNLFEQFYYNIANVYFLFVGGLQMIPMITTTEGLPTMYQPLAFIVLVSMARAGTEDRARHQADAQRNNAQYDVLRPEGFTPIASGTIVVGDILKIKQDQMVPADCLFLSSANPKGVGFIDKANLNGETALEVLNCVKYTKGYTKDSESGLYGLDAELVYEAPNSRFDKLRGQMSVLSDGGQPMTFPVDGSMLLMRETTLRNTTHVYALVLYTGQDTKIQRSTSESGKPPEKRSRIFRLVDDFLFVMLFLQIMLCFGFALGAGLWYDEGKNKKAWYLQFEDSSFEAGTKAFGSWFILLSQLVPISLIVSQEIVKTMQSQFFQWDVEMFYDPIDKPCVVNVSTIHEDLGLIDYIFSDKTGTLTQNKMEFRYVLTPNNDYGSKETEIAKSVKRRREAMVAKRLGQMMEPTVPWTGRLAPLLGTLHKPEYSGFSAFLDHVFAPIWGNPRELDEDNSVPPPVNEFTPKETRDLLEDIWGPNGNKSGLLTMYMRHMALSNTVKPYESEDNPGVIQFQAESAEELAMVQFAAKCGFQKLKSGNPTVLEITEYNADIKTVTGTRTEKYQLLGTLGFTSQRARVTLIYKGLDDGKIHVMMKGQDTVALPLLPRDVEQDPRLQQSLKEMSANGLRTLVLGHATLENSWWEAREEQFQYVISRDESEASSGHSAGKCQKSPACEKCEQHEYFHRLEKEAKLKYLGVMGMEDQLQVLVPECIADCLRAQIRVWMITGDKLETAKNIGLACNLIDPDMTPSMDDLDSEGGLKPSRLLEITGQWAELSKSPSDLGRMFEIFDADHSGYLDEDELRLIFVSMNLPNVPGLNLDNSAGKTKQEFIELMTGLDLKPFDAVKHDILEAIRVINGIEDIRETPVSVLVNRYSFQVLFPSASVVLSAQEAKRLEYIRTLFFAVAMRAKSVVFARAEPAMKKRMVTEIMDRNQQATCLAIGDGANDTDMIQAAHIGVGIAGVEGTAATQAADYAIGTFRHLHTLLFVHGYWSYSRISQLVLFIFYKTAVLSITAWFFGFDSAYSGQQYYFDAIYQLYNVAYTALPIIIVALLDQPLPRDTLHNNPKAYHEQKYKVFGTVRFFGWIFRAFVHSWIIYYVPRYSLGVNSLLGENGLVSGMYYVSTITYYSACIVPNLIIFFELNTVSFLVVSSVLLSLGSLWLMSWMISLPVFLPWSFGLLGVVDWIMDMPGAWMTTFITVVAPCLLELGWRAFKRHLRPSLKEVLLERLYQQESINRGKRRVYPHNELENVYGDEDAVEILAVDRARLYNSQAQLTPQNEQAWFNRKTHKPFKGDPGMSEAVELIASTSRALDKHQKHKVDPEAQAEVLRAMIRFKTMTGGDFVAEDTVAADDGADF